MEVETRLAHSQVCRIKVIFTVNYVLSACHGSHTLCELAQARGNSASEDSVRGRGDAETDAAGVTALLCDPAQH